jgi:hypothetical protein
LTVEESKRDDVLDRLILDMKGASLLYGGSELEDRLEQLTKSPDEDVQRFLRAVQVKKAVKWRSKVVIAAGELFMAAILVVAGTAMLVPSVVGVDSLSGLSQYFSILLHGGSTQSPLTPYLSLIEFGIGIVLVISAFFALGEAASNLKESGLVLEPKG